MNQKHQLFIGPDGLIKLIYDDELAGLLQLGAAVVARASHVEPAPGGWSADMAPSGGPVLGPFPLRRLALAAEVEWLDRQLKGSGTQEVLL